MILKSQPFNLATFICGHLFRGERPITYVFHSHDGSISMLCGGPDCDVEDVENCKLVCLGHMIEKEPKLSELDWLPVGFEAWNNPEGGWILTPLPSEEIIQ